MMEKYFYFTVKLTVCGYVLYRLWKALFGRKLSGLWGRIFVNPGKGKRETAISVVPDEYPVEVVGRTKVVYLEDPELAAKVPVRSEKLEPSGFIGEEPGISDEDVESDLSPSPETPEEILEEQERFEVMDDLSPGLDPDFSTGLTYEEMGNAVGVLTVATDDEKQIIAAAKTIHSIRDTGLFEFFTHQVSNLDNVERLLNDCLDNDGTPLAVRKSKRNERTLDSFDLSNFV